MPTRGSASKGLSSRGYGVRASVGKGPLVLNENPAARTVWLPLQPSVRLSGVALTGVFD